jgi:hypothetical protein
MDGSPPAIQAINDRTGRGNGYRRWLEIIPNCFKIFEAVHRARVEDRVKAATR